MPNITFPVEATHIMMFARAIGDDNPVYRDTQAANETEAKGVIAPPTFVQAVAQFDPQQVRPRPGEMWFGSGKSPTGSTDKPASGGSLHAEQEYTYHRALRPGDVLTVEMENGKVWEKQSKRRGTSKLIFRERITTYRDASGELVITARNVGVTILPLVDAVLGEG
ncbi:MaoC family dehydratase N-terminal domain-containing protein [Arthrobacter sp. efr-133-TYG-118]|uniref:FAS1-like dehydratase domain-containing protein n=1 Tax=Arthrobacter sp. efr-133-TYG-118 TaxID=3040279 RepID=UPI00254C5FDF|nr:MaoC family dehydratase N-terminal domain-containing protein [Arthrobacter sp. efr-133-TYG-118]